MIAIKLDEDLPNDLVEILAALKMDVTSVRLQGWTGRPDEQLFRDIQGEGRWLLTADKGFSDIRRYRPGTHCGIVLFRPDRESRRAYLSLATKLMETVDLAIHPGSLIVVTTRGIRIVHGTLQGPI